MPQVFYDEDDEPGHASEGVGIEGIKTFYEEATNNSQPETVYEPKLAYEETGMWKKWSNRGGIIGWVVGKPKLAAKLPQDPLSPKVKKINTATVVFRLALLTVAMLAVTTLAMWLIFGLTFMPTVKASGSYYLVDRTSWTEGEAGVGSYAFVLGAPVERSLESKVLNLFPLGESTGSVMKIEGKNEQGDYLTTCVSGECESLVPENVSKETYLISVPTENVLGEVAVKVGFLQLDTLR